MRNPSAICIGFVIGAVSIGSLALLRADPLPQAPAPPAPQIGRYEICVHSAAVWCVDTVTGETWYRDASGGWKRGGQPPLQRKD